MFQDLKKGDRVSVDIEKSEEAGFSKKIHGRTGLIEEKNGKAYIVKIYDGNREKRYIIKPVHLRKLR